MAANSTHKTSADPSTEISVPPTKTFLEFVVEKYKNGSPLQEK
jgi:hypothetical protein